MQRMVVSHILISYSPAPEQQHTSRSGPLARGNADPVRERSTLETRNITLDDPEIVNITPLYEELGTNLDERGPDGEACHLLDIGLCGCQTKGDFCDFV
jgi:hypothetical protein